MCEAKVYLEKQDGAQKIMEDVILVRPDPESGAYLLLNILGEQKLVRGTIEKIDFLRHTVHLSPAEGPADGGAAREESQDDRRH